MPDAGDDSSGKDITMADNNKKSIWDELIKLVVWFNRLFKKDENSKVGLVCFWIHEFVVFYVAALLLDAFLFKDFSSTTKIGTAVAIATAFTLLVGNAMKKR